MNATVARIVELMFEDIEMNDEVQAIHDEVMNNCQERFNDLTAGGMSEDDATAAVVESLKGMDEVLASYPRKKAEPAEEEDDGISVTLPAGNVRDIDIHLISQELTVEESCDENIHVESDLKALQVHTNAETGLLSISLPDDYRQEHPEKEPQKFQVDKDFTLDLNKIFVSISKGLDALSRSISVCIKDVDGHVTLQLPSCMLHSLRAVSTSGSMDVSDIQVGTMKLHSTSGDMEIKDCRADLVNIVTTSGDVSVDDSHFGELTVSATNGDVEIHNDEDSAMESLQIKTTSGDIDGEVFARFCTVNTISGDVELEGRLTSVTVNTTSGDMTLRADMSMIDFHTVSGDVELICDSDQLRGIKGRSVSGDVTVRTPRTVPLYDLHLSSTSGDVSYDVTQGCALDAVPIQISTVSGDIDVR